VAPLSKQKMSLATVGIYCTTSLPLSRAMEDSSIVQVHLQILYRRRYCIHVTMHVRHCGTYSSIANIGDKKAVVG